MTAFWLTCCIAIANSFLIARFFQKKITYPTDLLARMAGVSFFIVYIHYQYQQRMRLNIGFDSALQWLSWVNWGLIMMIFVFFIGAYLFRSNPVVRAKGLRETLLPLWCGVTPVLLLETPRLGFLPNDWIQIIATTLPWKLSALACLALGHAISLVGFLYLGRAFSIMVQARHVVRDGPYRYIRHPIYVGEGVAIIGIFLDTPNGINALFTLFWMIAQFYRAKLEEAKLASAFVSYADYKEKTGACFPRF